MKFRMRASVTFEAEDLDEAFLLLALHFLNMRVGHDSSLFDVPSNIEIVPEE